MRQLMAAEHVLVGGIVKIDQLPLARLRLFADIEVDRIAPHRQEVLVVAFLERCCEPGHLAAADRRLRVVDAGNPDRLQGPAKQCASRLLHEKSPVKGPLKCAAPSTILPRTSGMYPGGPARRS